MKKIIYISLFILLVSLHSSADVRINGFANFVGGITTDSEESLLGYEDTLIFDPESMFAVQISGDINDKTTATAQIVSRGANDYEVSFDWAYFTYSMSTETKISGGRFRLPLFKYSASLDVGYSYHWIRPPESVYGVAFNNVEGIRFDHNSYSGDWEYQIQVILGSFDQVVVSGVTGAEVPFDLNELFSVSLQLQREWLSLRTLYARGKNNFPNPAFFPLLEGLTLAGRADLADLIQIEDDKGEFYEMGLDFDFFEWFVGLEYVNYDTAASYAPKVEAFYGTAGIRYGEFTPHITFEKYNAWDKNGKESFSSLIALIPDPGLQATTIGTLALARSKNTRVTVGLRWDFQPNTAFNVDVISFEDELNDNNEATLVSLGVSYVF